MKEISQSIAKSFRAKAKVRFTSGCPSLFSDERLSRQAVTALKATFGEDVVYDSAGLGGNVARRNGGSEDFAYISREVPSVMIAISAGKTEEGYDYPLHHPKAKFDESALCVGVATYASLAFLTE